MSKLSIKNSLFLAFLFSISISFQTAWGQCIEPTGGLSLTQNPICKGEFTNLIFSFNNTTAPHEVVYTDQNFQYILSNIKDSYALPVSPTSTTGYRILRVKNQSTGCESSSTGSLVTVVVNQPPTLVSTFPLTKEVCSDEKIGEELLLENNVQGTFDINVITDPIPEGLTPILIRNNARLSSQDILDDSFTNNSITQKEVIYEIKPTGTNTTCVGEPILFTLIVNPKLEPKTNQISFEVCSETSLNYELSNSIKNSVSSTFSWIASDNSNVTGESLSLKMSEVIDDRLVNVGNATETVEYTINAQTITDLGSCTTDEYKIDIVVNPLPTSNNVEISQCNETKLDYDLSTALTSGLSSNFEWKATSDNKNVSGESLSPVRSKNLTDLLSNQTSNLETVVYSVTPITDDGCKGADFEVKVSLQPTTPLPQIINNHKYYCFNETNFPDDDFAVNGANLIWYSDESLTIEIHQGQVNNPLTQLTVDPSTSGVTNYYVTRGGNDDPSCRSEALKVVVEILQEIDQNIIWSISNLMSCQGGGGILSATIPNPKEGVTYIIYENTTPVSDPPVTAPSSSSLSLDFLPSFLSSGVGTKTLKLSAKTKKIDPSGNVIECEIFSSHEIDDFTVIPSLSPANAGSDQTKCNDGNFSLTGNFPPGYASGSWSFIGPEHGAKLSTISATEAQINGLELGETITLRWTLFPSSEAGCYVSFDEVSITNFNQTMPEIYGKSSVCYSSSERYETKSGMSNYSWNITAGTITNGGTAGDNYVVVNWGNSKISDNTAVSVSYDYPNVVGGGCPSSLTRTFNVNILEEQIATLSLSNSIICAGESTSLEFDFGTGNETYDVIYSDGTNRISLKDIGNSSNHLITPAQTKKYSLISVKNNKNGCITSITSNEQNSVEVVVNSSPIFDPTFSLNDNICSGENNSFDLTVNVSNSIPSNFSWIAVENPNVFGESSITATNSGIIDDVILNNTNQIQVVEYVITPTSDIGSCTGDVFSYFLSVYPMPSIDISDGVTSSTTICSGESTGFTLNSNLSTNVSNVSFKLETVSNSTGVTGFSQTGIIIVPGHEIKDELSNNTNMPITITYSFSASVGNCSNNKTTFDKSITVNPIPTVDITNQLTSICSGETTNIIVDDEINNVNFTWTVSSPTEIVGGSNSIGSINTSPITQILTNTSNQPQTIKYTITPNFSATCQGNPQIVAVTVNPIPNILVNNNSPIICSGSKTDIQISNPNNVDKTSFSWKVIDNQNNIENAFDGSGSTIQQVLQLNNDNDQGTVTYQIMVSTNTCDGNTQDVKVSVNQAPKVGIQTDNDEICADQTSIELVSSITGSATSATWSGGTNANGIDNIDGFSKTMVQHDEKITYTISNEDRNAGNILFILTSNNSGGPCIPAIVTKSIEINSLPIVSFSSIYNTQNTLGIPKSLPESGSDLTLIANPSGGVFSGDGVIIDQSNVFFSPKNAKIEENNVITYTFTDVNKCTNTYTSTTYINAIPKVQLLGESIHCLNAGVVPLKALPDGGVWTGNGVFVKPDNNGNDTYYFDVDNVGIGSHLLTYKFTGGNGATAEVSGVHIVLSNPIIDFNLSSYCVDDEIVFLDASTNKDADIINVDFDEIITDSGEKIPIEQYYPIKTELKEWQWTFFDVNQNTGKETLLATSLDQNSKMNFGKAGTKKIKIKVSSISSSIIDSQTNFKTIADTKCSSVEESLIVIGSTPDPRFESGSTCEGSYTAFSDDTILEEGSIINYNWDFGDGSAEATDKNPKHLFDKSGEYKVTLTVETDKGCIKNYEKTINIEPLNNANSFPYIQNFDVNDGAWSKNVKLLRDESLQSKNSWIYLNNSQNNKIKAKYEGDGFWWTGNNNDSYFKNEQSWVLGPCFDFSKIKNPMISMKLFSDTFDGLDGALLQYSTDQGLSWKNVGELSKNSGINWYNSNSISAKPGNQKFGFGWTGTLQDNVNEEELKWIEVKHNLDMLKEFDDDYIQFRIAFGSVNIDNNETKLGFAFDDIYIGEREKVVLLEHFTDMNHTNYLNWTVHLQNLKSISRISESFTEIYYHINESGYDQFYLDNPGDPSARSLYYGVYKPPFTTLDGSNSFDDNTFSVDVSEIDSLSLLNPKFQIKLDPIIFNPESNYSNDFIIKGQIIALEDISELISIHIGVVESNSYFEGKNYRYVLKKLLLGAEGKMIQSIKKGETESIDLSWRMDVPIRAINSTLNLTVFVQNYDTREVYQTKSIEFPKLQKTVITGFDREITTQSNQILMYPNPASFYVNFSHVGYLEDQYTWSLIDQRGVEIDTGIMHFDSNGIYKLDVSFYKDGIYNMVLKSKNMPLVYKKLVIMNQ